MKTNIKLNRCAKTAHSKGLIEISDTETMPVFVQNTRRIFTGEKVQISGDQILKISNE